jgi:hypothetical protein
VFTAKVRTSDESLVPTQHGDVDCLRCQLWNIINPDGNLKCDDCTSGNSEALETVIGAAEVLKTTTVALGTNLPGVYGSKDISRLENTGRCSACGISALIDPSQPFNCASCTTATGLSSLNSSGQPSNVRRSCARRPPTKLESHATRCLQGWLKEHQNNPYPDTETKRSLAEQCGITEKQVNTWFTNARARRRVLDAKSSNPVSEDETTRKTRLSSLTSTVTSNRNGFLGFEVPSDCRHPFASHYTGDSSHYTTTTTSRRGKKKDYGQSSNAPALVSKVQSIPSKPRSLSANDADNESQMWQCTFCYQNIAPKSWRRHEETQHRPKRKWTCLLTGPSLTIPSRSDTSRFCVFCMISNPSDKHFAECHRIAECWAKDEDERTFLRPDHLRQHVKNFHKAKLEENIRDLWRREGPDSHSVENWVCGFCAKVLKTWDDRETHVAGHFKDGLTMAEWEGYTPSEIPVEASKKRPTSSEGRPNVFSKLARTLTGRSTHRQYCDESHNQFAQTFDAAQTFVQAPELDAPLLPELIFDDFMPGDSYFHYNDSSLAGAYEHDFPSAERYDSVLPDGNDTSLDFGNLAEGFIDEQFSNAHTFGLWYQ